MNETLQKQNNELQHKSIREEEQRKVPVNQFQEIDPNSLNKLSNKIHLK